MIKIEVKAPEVKADIAPAISKSLWQSATLVRGDASKLAPYRTGTLRRSLTEKVYTDKAIVGTNIAYARIHELGGDIVPKNKPFLVFQVGGKRVRTKKVKIKARPYLRPALEQNIDKITKIFSKNIGQFILK